MIFVYNMIYYMVCIYRVYTIHDCVVRNFGFI